MPDHHVDPDPRDIQAARDGWRYRGGDRPAFAITPGVGQESVWDYPRPPALVRDSRLIRVSIDERLIAETRAALRMLETAGAPTFYLPPDDVDGNLLRATETTSFCEWKGWARYWDVVDGERLAANAVWAYPAPDARYRDIAGFMAFYAPSLTCSVDGERVRPQPGDFYGGWVTDEVVGPFKGEPGTAGW